jgi:uncharacterized protein YcbK (DUF882 family)
MAAHRPAFAALAAPSAIATLPPTRTLSLFNIHTGEKAKIEYCVDGMCIPEALGEIRKFLRDYRNGQEHDINTGLLDLLVTLKGKMDTTSPFHVISGYRSPQTNEMLHDETSGVAKHSLHMEGMAIDIRLPGRDLAALHKTALSLKAGGVGYYPASDFVHVDVGRVRHWG